MDGGSGWLGRRKRDVIRVDRLVDEAMRQWSEWWLMVKLPEVERTPVAKPTEQVHSVHSLWRMFFEPKAPPPIVTRVGVNDPVLNHIIREERQRYSLASTTHLILSDMEPDYRYPLCQQSLGKTQSMIASVMGITQSTVSRRITVGREILGGQLLNNPVVVRRDL